MFFCNTDVRIYATNGGLKMAYTNIRFDFNDNTALINGEKMSLDYLIKQWKEILNSPECIGFYCNDREMKFIIDYHYSGKYRNNMSYWYTVQGKDMTKIKELLSKLEEANTKNIISKLENLKTDVLNNYYMNGKIELSKSYINSGSYTLSFNSYNAKYYEKKFVELSSKNLKNLDIKNMIDDIIYIHDNAGKHIFYKNFNIYSSFDDTLYSAVVNSLFKADITKVIFNKQIDEPLSLKTYLNKHRFTVLKKLITQVLHNDISNFGDNFFSNPFLITLWALGILFGVGLNFWGLELGALMILLGSRLTFKTLLINKNIKTIVECLDEKYNLEGKSPEDDKKIIENKDTKEREKNKVLEKSKESVDPFLRNLFTSIAKMKEYPETDWTYEAETISDLAKKYVEAKQKSDLTCYELLRKYPNFLEISNKIDEQINAKIIPKYTNELQTLETISTELDGLKSVTLDTKIRKLTK